MNLFKILSSGDGKIYEPTVSAFLAFLLDPKELHGLGSNLLEAILEPIITAKENEDEFADFITIDKKIVNLSNYSSYSVVVEQEMSVEIENKRRDIDIVIEIKKDKKNIMIVCIENKIKSSSGRKGQITDQINGIIKNYPDKEEINFVYIYLVPKNDKNTKELFKVTEKFKNVTSKMIYWKNTDDKEININELLSNILIKEDQNKIEPINTYSKHTIKAFIQFINTDFKSYAREKSERRIRAFENKAAGYNNYMLEKGGEEEVINGAHKIIDYCKYKLNNRISVNYNWSYIFIYVDKKHFLQFKGNARKYQVKIISSWNGNEVLYEKNNYTQEESKWNGENPKIIISDFKKIPNEDDGFWRNLDIAINTVLRS